MASDPITPVADTPERRAFYERISQKHLTPLWTSLAKLVTPEPASACQPASWAFAEIRAAMIEAGALITAKEAERRVLMLENPGLRGQSKITTDLYAGVQLVLPGEVAPAHRHTPSPRCASSSRATARTPPSTANGRRCTTATSSSRRRWRGTTTAIETDQPMFWLDGLDIPIVQFLDASFAEHHDEDEQPIRRRRAIRRRASARTCCRSTTSGTGASPVFNYPYARTREALTHAAAPAAGIACHGLKMRYSQSGHWRLSDGDDRRLHPAAAERILVRPATARPMRRSSSPSKGEAARASAPTSSSTGSRATSSWCRAGSRVRHEADGRRRAVLVFGPSRPGSAASVSRGARSMPEARGARGHAAAIRLQAAVDEFLSEVSGSRRNSSTGFRQQACGRSWTSSATSGSSCRSGPAGAAVSCGARRSVGPRSHRQGPAGGGSRHGHAATDRRAAGDSTVRARVGGRARADERRAISTSKSAEPESPLGRQAGPLHRRRPARPARRETPGPGQAQRVAVPTPGAASVNKVGVPS